MGDMAADDDDGKHASDGKDDDDGKHKDATQDGARLSAQDAWQAQLMHQENSGGLCLRVRGGGRVMVGWSRKLKGRRFGCRVGSFVCRWVCQMRD